MKCMRSMNFVCVCVCFSFWFCFCLWNDKVWISLICIELYLRISVEFSWNTEDWNVVRYGKRNLMKQWLFHVCFEFSVIVCFHFFFSFSSFSSFSIFFYFLFWETRCRLRCCDEYTKVRWRTKWHSYADEMTSKFNSLLSSENLIEYWNRSLRTMRPQLPAKWLTAEDENRHQWTKRQDQIKTNRLRNEKENREKSETKRQPELNSKVAKS